jgi:hypothetical protein
VTKLSGYLSVVIGVALAAAAYLAAKPTLAFLDVALPATGKVVAVRGCTEGAPPFYRTKLDPIAECATVVFKAASGREVIGTVRGWPGRANKGELVDVLYDPNDPDRHGRTGLVDLWWFPGLLGIAAALTLLRGTVGLGRG